MEFPTLYGIASNGKFKKWIISMKENPDKTYSIITLNGYIDGKMNKSERIVKVGKNIGKKNETTIYEQAYQEANKKWIDKKEKEGYNENIESVKEPIFPMLAHKFEPNKKKKKDIHFPCFVQPKLDGYRCMVFETIKINFMSRVGKMFKDFVHLSNELKVFLEGVKREKYNDIFLDGELYSNEIPFEEISGMIRKEEYTEKDRFIEYHIYDLYTKENLPFEKRNEILQKIFSQNNFTYLKNVPTFHCQNISKMKEYHGEFVEQGFEGIILRNKDGFYKPKNRSYDLQKYKEFLDDEFKIVGCKEANGEDKGTIIWICEYQNKDGKKEQFSVRPKGCREIRKKYFDEFSKYNGKWLKVKYQELSETGCPRFPVGLEVRFDI